MGMFALGLVCGMVLLTIVACASAIGSEDDKQSNTQKYHEDEYNKEDYEPYD